MKYFATILPSLFAGALVFGSVVGNADDGRHAPPVPPTAPVAPRPPKPPKAPNVGGFGSGFNISIHDGKVTIVGLEGVVDTQINAALAQISSDPRIPPKVREKVTKRLEKIRAKVKARIKDMDAQDMEHLGEELGKLGEEIGEEMEQFGEEMDQWGSDMDQWGKNMDQWGKDFEKQWSKNLGKNLHFGPHGPRAMDDDDDDDDMPDMPDPDDVDDDVVRDLGDLSLSQPQREQLRRLRADSDAKVAQAKQALQRASDALEKQLKNPNASDADIARSIDAVATQEAAIRKARILAWVNARRMLDDGQRQKVEGAAKHRTK